VSEPQDLDSLGDEPLEEVAVVGMAGRFPGAPDLETFWRNLRDGVESISRFSDEEMLAAGVEPEVLANPRYVRARGVIAGAKLFDAPFFGLSPREAAITDPQQRVFLECAWEALEQAGIDPETHAGRIAVYAGQTFSTYLVVNLLSHGPSPDESWQMVMGNDKDTLATRVSYKLDLRGPSLSVGTACSTSLVTVHMARQALLDYECDVALAGGVAIRSPQATGYLFQEEGILSPDGHCRAFDAQGRGTVFSSGAGIVVLKRLSDALADGDTVRAVLKGSALNNDGANKIGFTAPSVEGQAEVIARALALAGVDPGTVGYVETHGTATPLGDPIEIAGLTRAFRAAGASRRGFCALGSVKSNIGHTDSAAGVAGLIKTVLALEHREIPPSLWIERPNPQIDFAASPFFVNDRLRPWEGGETPRRAGVSSFGIGGTNAHVVVEEAPELPGTSPAARPWQLLVLSAKTRSALESATGRLAAHLGGNEQELADVAFTLQVGRRALPWRRAVVCRDREDAVEALSGRDRLLDGTPRDGSASVAFLFPGQGSQRAGMGQELYLAEPLFRREVDQMATLLRPHLGGEDVRELIFEAAGRLDRTSITQPALFVIEMALARLWMSWGLQPQALLGHSVGEYVAAHLSGTLSLEDALALVAARGRLVEELPGGAMLAVPLAEEDVLPLLGTLSLAAVNGPAQCVVSGPEEAVEALRTELEARGVEGRRLATSHAFHSRQMEPVLEAFTKLVRGVALNPPEIPWISNVTGRWITAEEATDPLYWVRHLRETVRFADGLEALLAEPGRVLLEVGPGRTLTRLARKGHADRVAVPSLPAEEGGTEPAGVLAALGTLWAAGLAVDWKAFHDGERRRRVPLPTYPFERRRHWIEPARTAARHGLVFVEDKPEGPAVESGEDLASSDDPVVAGIARVWKEVLGVGRVGPHDRFFDLGGDSLIALRVVARLRQDLAVELPVRSLFEKATVPALRDVVEAAAEPPIPRRPSTGPTPLTFLQQQLWFLDQLEPGNPAYTLASQMRLSGALDAALFERAVREVVDRHEILRTVFRAGSDGPVQEALPAMAIPVQRVDLTALPPERRKTEWSRRAAEAVDRPFDLARGPLLRIVLAQVEQDEILLLLTTHHVIADGWSQGVLVRELAALYEGLTLPELPIQFADFAVWQRSQEPDLAYWRQQLADPPAGLELPSDRPRPAVQSFRGSSVPVAVAPRTAQALAGLARSEEATPFMAFLAGFLTFLLRHSGQEDLLVATSVAGRGRKELEGLFGLFINTLVLRGDLSGDPGFRELLRRVRRTSLEAFGHQLAPFERILEAVRPDRDLGRNPLFQVMFLFHNLPPVPEVSAGGLSFRPEEMESRASMFDLTLSLTERGGGVTGSLQYSSDLFDRPTVQRLAARYVALLEAAAEDSDRPLSELPLLLPLERRQVLAEWNDTATAYPTGVCLHELIAAQARRTPEAVAAVFEEESLTYRELMGRARGLARHLVRMGVEPDGRVGVLLERSLEMIVGLLGTLEAGAAYVPLDPTLPPERLAVLIESAGISVVLAQERHAGLLPGRGERTVLLDLLPPLPEGREGVGEGGRGGEGLAYVLFTSGSTGTPKGVMIPHRGIVNRLLWMQEAYGLTPDDRVLQKTPFSFDVSVWEFFWPLITGARLVFARPEGHKDPAYLAELIAREGITTLHFVPSMLQAFLEGAPGLESLTSLRRVMASGEALPVELVRRFFTRLGQAELHNLYGPTEASVDVSFWPCVPEPPRSIVPIGRPIANLRLHVVDRGLHAQAIGIPGELLLGGVGLARGYLARPDLTAAAFVPDPFGDEPGSRLYRTGDLTRLLSDGNVEYLGRIDHQVKIRGFRIELGEIEAVLSRYPSVRECVVVAREGMLVAYVTGGAQPAELRAFLGERLPEYMVPPVFVALEALPLSPNGKVDRKALPAPVRESAAGFAAPSDPVEELLAGLWSEVLRIERIGVHDNFFDLGGHSLMATRVRSRIQEILGVDLPLRKLFESPTVARLAAAVRAARDEGTVPALPLVRVPREGDIPLSFAQQRLWLLDQIEPGSAAYNLPAAVRLTGQVSVDLLERIFEEIVRRHESLRTTFPSQRGKPVQRIAPELRPEIRVIDLPGEAEARTFALEEARQPFDLENGPLLRLALVRLGERDSLLVMTMHHIVSDGWSWGVLLREIGVLYEAFSQDLPSPLPELPVQYADFAVWQREQLEGEVLERQLAWWKRQLAGAPAALELPTDRPRPALPSHRGGVRPLALPPDLLEGVIGVSRHHGATPFMALLAAWAVLLGRYAGQEQVLTGTPVAGRNRREVEDLIGFFVNTLVMHVRQGDGLEAVRDMALDAFTHQDLPFERLVDEVAPDRDLRRPPVFQVLFILQNAPLDALELEGLTLRQVPVDAGAAKFDLTLNLIETGGGLGGFLEYDADLFDAATAERHLRHYERLLRGIVAEPDLPIRDLPLLSEAERHQMLAEHNDSASIYPDGACVHELIAAQAARTPEAVAAGRMTYRELDRRAGRLARRLVRQGVGPDVLVGLSFERSPDLLVALLGVLKAGGAYVPLDPTHPRERLDMILEDAGVRILLTELEEDGEDVDVPLPAVDPENLAYVIYTSGSTGRPKGVEVRHRGVVNYLASMACTPVLGAEDVMMAVTTLSFDIAVTELLLPLTVGARVEIASRETAGDPLLLAKALETATCMQATPATWTMLLEGGWAGQPGLKALCGGEALPRALADRLLPRVGELWNVYGPTETTVWSALLRVGPGERPVPVGLPLANTALHLVDRDGELAPLGVAGELLIGGDGLARGYHGRPDLTAERFVPDPFGAPGTRLYRTGDLARRLPDGTLEFLGRIDFQVKVRGFRIELGEIEAVLASHPAVRECVVVARKDDGDTMLVAYVVGDASELRSFLGGKLPPYMVPAAFVTLPALPLSPNGKVDRKALPAPERQETGSFTAPTDPTEELVAGVWAEVLRIDRVGVHDSFFELGGHSLLGTQVVSRIREVLGVELPLRRLFEAPTVARLAEAVRAAREQGVTPAPPLIPLPVELRSGDLPLSFGQQRLWLLDQIEPGSAAYNLASAVRLGGELPLDLLERIFAEIVRRHESLRTTFPSREGKPVQVVAPFDPEIRVIDVSGEDEARERALEEVRRPFDLQRGPLLRLALLRLGESDSLLVMTMHHIVSDGWSWGVLLREIGVLYEAFSQGRPSPLPELPVQYADFAVWQRSWLEGEVLDRQLGWWKQQLAGAPAALELPTDRPRPALPTHRGGIRPVRLSPDLLEGVAAHCRRHGATPFMALLAAWAVLLGRHAVQDDVLVGTPVAGRTRRETEDLIGFFVNTLVMRVRLDDGLGKVRDMALDAFAHQDLPFERLVDEVAADRDLRRPPVFQVLFILQNAPLGALELEGLTLSQVPVDAGAAKFDLTLNLTATGGFLEYDADLFDATTAERLAGHYERLLRGLVADLPLADLPLMPEAERHQVLVEHNDAAAAYPADRCIHELVAAQAARTPEAPAVDHITYRELDRRAERLAWRLARRGVGPDVLVGLCADRSADLVVGLLAVLKAGGAYVPLDPTHPRERLAYIFADSGARVLLTERALAGNHDGAEVVLLDEEEEDVRVPLPAADPENLAYVIYTSGSTGKPKGVEVRHRGVVNYLATMADKPGLGAGDVMMAVTTLSFDIAVTELLLPLTVGAHVRIVSRETAADALLLASALEGATCMQATPATWTLLLEGGWAGKPDLKALCGGEALPRALADRLLPKVGELWNVYGPTETTVWSSVLRVGPGERPVPVGLPLGNTTLHLLDRDGALAPLGVAGELVIGGDGLARGYHGRPDLTAERFVPDPFGPAGSRLYRTGDLARRLPDGTLEFLGRIDFQVKVRGFRIELGEIEAVLASHPGVRECVVAARQDGPGDKMLVGYTVGSDVAPAELRQYLAGKLPPYMVPAAFVALPALPLSPNGKVDRKALPAPSRERAERPDDAPRTPAETALARAWEQVLGVQRAGLHDNFFELGGDSILAVQVVFRAREAGLALEARDLFRFPTLGETAAAIEAAPETPVEEPESGDFPEARISQRDLDKLMARIGGKRGSAARAGRGN